MIIYHLFKSFSFIRKDPTKTATDRTVNLECCISLSPACHGFKFLETQRFHIFHEYLRKTDPIISCYNIYDFTT